MLLFLGMGLALMKEDYGNTELHQVLLSALSESIEDNLRSGRLISEMGIPNLTPAPVGKKDDEWRIKE